MSVNKVVLINETIPPAFFSCNVDEQRGEEIIYRRIGEPLPRPGQAGTRVATSNGSDLATFPLRRAARVFSPEPLEPGWHQTVGPICYGTD